MNTITEVLPSLPEIDFSSRESLKSSLYEHTFLKVVTEATKANSFYHLDLDDVTPIQVLDTDSDNPVKSHIIYHQPKVKGGGDWYMYDGSVWVKYENDLGQDVVSTVLKAVDQAYADMMEQKAIVVPSSGDDKKDPMKDFKEKISKHKKVLGNLKSFTSATGYMTKYLSKQNNPFGEMRYIVLRDGRSLSIEESIKNNKPTFVKTGPEHFVHEMYRVTAEYIPNSTPGPALTHYLNSSFADQETGIKMCTAFACGLFSPRSSKQYSIIDMYGKPNTGKSTFIDSVIIKIAPGLIAIGSQAQFGNTFDKFAMKDLVGKRVTILSEFEGNFSTGSLKRITGEDPLSFDEKYGASGTFYYRGVVAITSNFRTGSKIDINVEGVKERLFPIHFPNAFQNGVGLSEDGATEGWTGPDLRTVALPAENDITFSWMVDNWLAFEQESSPTIPLSENQISEIGFRTGEADLFQEFLDDMQAVNGWAYTPGAKNVDMIKSSDALAKYSGWLLDHGYPAKRGPADFKMLRSDGKVDKLSGNIVLVNWVNTSNNVMRQNLPTDTGNGTQNLRGRGF